MSKIVNQARRGVLSITQFEKEGKRPNIVMQKARFITKENRWAKRGEMGHEEFHLFEDQIPQLYEILGEFINNNKKG
jgi:hypothetical protein